MPQGGPLNPVAALLEKLRAEQRNPTEQEKVFIAKELAKANDPMAGITAPPAGAPAPAPATDPYAPDAAKIWAQARESLANSSQPSVLDSPLQSATNTMVRGAMWFGDLLNPVTGAWQIEQGLNRAKYNPMIEITGGAVPRLSMTNDFYKAGADISGGIMQAGLPLAALSAPRALASGIPAMAFADRILSAAANDPNIDPDKLMFGANMVGMGMMGHGFKGDIAAAGAPRAEYTPWHNLDPHAVIEAQRTGGGSFDPITGQQIKLNPGDAAAALGRRSTQVVTSEPIHADDLLNFLDTQQGPLSRPGRVLGVYPGDKGHYAEVSQTYRGEGAADAAMRDAYNAPLQQESIFVQGADGPEFPTVPLRNRPIENLRTGLKNLYENDKGELNLGRMVDKDFTVKQTPKGEFSAINPDTRQPNGVKQGKPEKPSGPKREDIIPVDVKPEWADRLKAVGVEEFKQMPTQSFEQTFKLGEDGMLELHQPIKERLKTLYAYGKNVVKANWTDNKPLFRLANEITSHNPGQVTSRGFAALSPQVNVAQNLHDLLKVFNRIKQSGKDPAKMDLAEMTRMAQDVGNPDSKVPNLMRAFNNEPLSSYGGKFSSTGKVEHLAEGMFTGERGIPFDLWMNRVLGLPKDAPPTNSMGYEAMYRAVAGVAKELKTTPFEMMHQIWSAARTIHGSETIGPTQMLEVAGVDKVPGTSGFERQLDRGLINDIPKLQAQQRKGMLWDIKGNLLGNGTDIRSLALPIGAATAYMLMDDEQKKKVGAGLLMGAIAPTRVRSIMEDFKTTTHGVHSPAHYTAVEEMLQQPSAVVLKPGALPQHNEPKFVLPTGDSIGGPFGVTHAKFAGPNGGFEKVMEAGAHRISYDKAYGNIGQGVETWSPFTSRAADTVSSLHETITHATRPHAPETIGTVVDVHKPAAADTNPRYRFTDYLGSKEIYDLNADKLRAFADGLFAKAKAAAVKK